MVDYEKFTDVDTSDRAPVGMPEVSIQATTPKAMEYGPGLQQAMDDYVTGGIDVQSYEYDDDQRGNRVAIYVGTDRVNISTLRDIAEVYGQYVEFPGGNIPPNLTLVPTTEQSTTNTVFAWFEFTLKGELPEAEVQMRINDAIGETPVEGKNPIGEESQAIVYRDGNVTHQQIRDILNKASNINDVLPIDHMQVVCETAEPYTR